MIKEFSKLTNNYEIQINLTNPIAQEAGIEAKIIFIPLKKDLPTLIPVRVWGSEEDVENSIRFELDNLATLVDVEDDAKKHDEYIKYVPTPEKKEVKKTEPPKKKLTSTEKLKKAPDSKNLDISVIFVKDAILNSDKLADDNVEVNELIDKTRERQSEVLSLNRMDQKGNVTHVPLKSAKEEEERAEELFHMPTEDNLDQHTALTCDVCAVDMDIVNKQEKKSCTYKECPHGKYTDPFKALKKDDIAESGVNMKALTPEENRLRGAMIKDEVKAITPQEAFSDNPVVDMSNVEREKINSAPKLIFANGNEIEIGKSVIEQIDEAPINCEDPEYGHCNSIDNEGENDDLPQHLQDEPEISEQEQMMIDERDRALNEAKKKEEEEKEAESTNDYMQAQADAEADNSWSAPTFNF